jgi:hypothetical protein
VYERWRCIINFKEICSCNQFSLSVFVLMKEPSLKLNLSSEVSLRYYRGCTIRITRILVLDVADQLIVVYDRRRLCLFLSFQFPENINVPFRHGLMKRPVRQKYKTQTKIQNQHSTLILPCAPLFLYHGALTYLAKLFTHKSEEGFYRFCSKRQKFCSFARHTLTINTTPISSIAMHISSLLDPFHVHFKFLSTPKYHYSKKCPEVHLEWVQQ